MSIFRIASKRTCPPIEERAIGDNLAAVEIGVESMEHVEKVSKPYDPHVLKNIFPDDGIVLQLRIVDNVSSSPQWRRRAYYIFPDRIYRFASESADFPIDNSKVEDFLKKRQPDNSLEAEGLLSLCTFLEMKYRSMQLNLPNPKSRSLKSGFFNKLLSGKRKV